MDNDLVSLNIICADTAYGDEVIFFDINVNSFSRSIGSTDEVDNMMEKKR